MFLYYFYDNDLNIFMIAYILYCSKLLVVDFSVLNVFNFFNIFVMKLNAGHFSSGTVTIHFLDTPYQEIYFEKSFK